MSSTISSLMHSCRCNKIHKCRYVLFTPLYLIWELLEKQLFVSVHLQEFCVYYILINIKYIKGMWMGKEMMQITQRLTSIIQSSTMSVISTRSEPTGCASQGI